MDNLNRLRAGQNDKEEVEKREELFKKLREDDEFWRVVRGRMEGMVGRKFS